MSEEFKYTRRVIDNTMEGVFEKTGKRFRYKVGAMKKGDLKYDAFVSILHEELVPAMGCTEPISLAFVAAKAREVLGCLPDSVEVGGSGSIIKNVKSVIVPHTGGMTQKLMRIEV